jgi:hypothetical protein
VWASHSFDDVSHPPKSSRSNRGARWRRTVAVPGSGSIARAAAHRRSKAHADPLCPKVEGATNTHSVHGSARAFVFAPGGAPPRTHRPYPVCLRIHQKSNCGVWAPRCLGMGPQRVPDSQRADTILTPLGAQYGATACNPENRNRHRYATFATLGNPLQRLRDHS